MNFNPKHLGIQETSSEDATYNGSRFADVRNAIFANSYYLTWGASNELPLPVFGVTLRRTLKGILPFGMPWRFLQASRRSIQAKTDLRWGSDRRGFRRILHPNGVCMTGMWEITDEPPDARYTGYFRKGSKALIVGRYSTCCSETRRGRSRSLALVGKLFPTTDPHHPDPLPTANFITQEDIGGGKLRSINEAELRNAPDVTPWHRGVGLPILLVTAWVLLRTDKMPNARQLYEIAELDKPPDEATNAPEFMRLRVDPSQPILNDGDDLDFRDEVLGHIYDRGDKIAKRALTFLIDVADVGRSRGLLRRRTMVDNWYPIGRIIFREAVASYNGDFVLHFRHPPWRNNRNDPDSLARRQRE